MEWLLDIKVWSSLLTLTVLEIVLGIDNIIFMTIMVSRVPAKHRNFARQFGLLAAMGTRILLLLSVAWLARLVQPLFEIMEHPVSGRDLVLFQLLPLWTGRAVNFVTSGSGWPFFHSPRGKSGMSHGLNR